MVTTMEGVTTMNKSKLLEYFDASVIKAPIHVIGCGAIGSNIAEQLARIGVEEVHLWDFDTVAAHNITNQMFDEADIGRTKVEAVTDMMKAINPAIIITTHAKGLTEPYVLAGYVFLCVDNIDLRREIVKANQYNPNLVAFFDFRMRLTDAQHYAALKSNAEQVKQLLATMDFTHEEAKNSTPKSACNVELSVCYTVKTIVAIGVANFVRSVLGDPIKTMVLIDLEQMTLDAFPMD